MHLYGLETRLRVNIVQHIEALQPWLTAKGKGVPAPGLNVGILQIYICRGLKVSAFT